MKKLAAIILSAAMALSLLAGCGSDPTKDFTANQKKVYETVKEFKGTERYKEVAKDATKVEVLNAVEVTIEDMDGQSVHALVIEVDVNMDIYGDTAGVLAVDLENNKVYDDTMIDWDALGNGITSQELAVQLILNCGESYFHNGAEQLWTEMETRVDLSDTEIAAINKAINK